MLNHDILARALVSHCDYECHAFLSLTNLADHAMSVGARKDASGIKPSGSLSTVVSSLVRAQYGLASQEATSTETDLDKHVAELLLQEAKAREERAKKDSSYAAWRFSDDEDGDDASKQAPKTNKRFLKNLIKGVEDFNVPLRRNEDPRLAAHGLANGGQKVRKSKEEMDAIRRREREERERRTGVRDAERSHNRSRYEDDEGANVSSRANDADNRDRPSSSRPSTSTSRAAGPSNYAARMLDIGLSSARASRREEDKRAKEVQEAVDAAKARAAERERHRSRESDSDAKGKHRDGSDHHRRYEEREPRPHRRRSRSPRASSRSYDDRAYDREVGQHSRRSSPADRSERTRDDKSSRHQRQRSSSVSSDTASSTSGPQHRKRRRSRPPANSDSENEGFVDYTGHGDGKDGSKMGKYFTSTYDPALDISFQDLEDPSTGLIAESNFSGWDAMLDVLKKRKEDKVFGVTRAREEERERQLRRLDRKKRREERDARRSLRDGKRKKRKRDDDESADSDSSAHVGPRPRAASPQVPATINIGGFEYGKKGSTRAWDLGKDSATL